MFIRKSSIRFLCFGDVLAQQSDMAFSVAVAFSLRAQVALLNGVINMDIFFHGLNLVNFD